MSENVPEILNAVILHLNLNGTGQQIKIQSAGPIPDLGIVFVVDEFFIGEEAVPFSIAFK